MTVLQQNGREQCETSAKITTCEVGRLGPHGTVTVQMEFDAEDVDQLHLSDYTIDSAFIRGLCGACGVKRLRDCEGEIVKVEYLEGTGVGGRAPEVVALKPMPFDDEGGLRFDVQYWLAWAKAEADGGCEFNPFEYRRNDDAKEQLLEEYGE